LFFLILVVSCINPIYPSEMYLQHSATLVVAAFLIYSTFKNNLSNKSFVLIAVFTVFHIIGARWIYSYTPYDQWIKSITGISINSWFGFERNQYDRLIHFLFGFLILIPLQELFQRTPGLTWKTSLLMALLTILSLSTLYEVFEWMLSIVLSPEDAELYNGQQGDFWDAQKDMALAFVGSLCMIFIICTLHFIRRKD
jgi:putative membrane protein